MNVLSLFDGMACGMLAMQKAGIEVDRYVAFEIDKYATQTSSHNFPMIEHRGDVFKADFTEFRGFDFLVGGSPCTYMANDSRTCGKHFIGQICESCRVSNACDVRARAHGLLINIYK